MKLRTKLLLGYGGFVLSLAVLGAWSARTLSEMSAVSGRIIAENYDSVVAAQDMKESLERQDSAALFDLLTSSGVPSALRTLGLQEESLVRAVDVALAQPYWNPRPLERDGILALLNDAWQGRRPHVSSMASH